MRANHNYFAADNTQCRCGFTMLEVLTVIAIVSVLAALLVPAVQGVREAARKTTCRNNMRQLGVAMANFADAYQVFPTGHQGRLRAPATLLPYLEQQEIHGQLAGGRIGAVSNVPVLCCPTDPEIWAKNSAGNGDASYLMCRGTLFPNVGTMGQTNGFVSHLRDGTRPRDISDGLSNTVAMSERLVIPIHAGATPSNVETRSLWWTVDRFHLRGEEELAAEQARNHRVSTSPLGLAGLCHSYFYNQHYDHILPPNSPGVHNGPDDYDSIRYSHVRLVPPSSLHHGGVFSLFADGSVNFQSDGIDLVVWRAVGTRSGGESTAVR